MDLAALANLSQTSSLSERLARAAGDFESPAASRRRRGLQWRARKTPRAPKRPPTRSTFDCDRAGRRGQGTGDSRVEFSASSSIQIEVFLEQPGTDAEFPQASADRSLVAEGQGVSTLQGLPAETVSQSESANHHRSQGGAWHPLRLVAKTCDLARALLVCRNRLQLPESRRQLPDDVLLCHLHHRLTTPSSTSGDDRPSASALRDGSER